MFVQCADDIVGSETFNLESSVRRAHKRLAEDLGISRPVDEPAFGLPHDSQRTLYILDGLDEVIWGRQQLEDLFARLAERATDRQRIVVFTRPGVVPARERIVVFTRPGVVPARERLRGASVLELLPFHTAEAPGELEDQIAIWLDAWNRHGRPDRAPISSSELAQRGLLELARTPILLFMIAYTWDDHGDPDAQPTRARIYEHFFQQMARGKHELDKKAAHRPIADAAERLRDHLLERHEISQEARPPDAMLWLMSRVAWEQRRLASRKPPKQLDRHDVVTLLRSELDLDASAADTVQVGLLLSLQADLRGDHDQVLFGHKSFREFLVARYWADRLYKLVNTRERDRRQYVEMLLGARLLDHKDHSFEFLMEMINSGNSPSFAWDDQLRKQLVQWAEECFCNETLYCPKSQYGHSDITLRSDQSAVLREAALAIGSSITGSPGIKARDPDTLRSLLAWFWLSGDQPLIIAQKAKLQRAKLQGANLIGADFMGADFMGADLMDADLRGANLGGANLGGAILVGANLTTAILQEANIAAAMLQRAMLEHANLIEAELRHAYLMGANLSGADLTGTNLSGAVLTGTNLEGAILERAILEHANLTGANLAGANLTGADLTGTNLTGTIRKGVNLEGTKL